SRGVFPDKQTTLPVQSGASIGAGDYVVTVGLGTPKKEFTLIFDTGSDVTWTQCEPCVKSCYEQKEPRNLNPHIKNVFKNFVFGCGQQNDGLFGRAAGLLGLGRTELSLPSQAAKKFKKLFSYCLPASSSSKGYLSFGGKVSKTVTFTPLSKASESTPFYGLDITGLSVGGHKLSIDPSIFSTSGTIIDSGTVFSRLPPTVYSALSSAFKKLMTNYPLTGGNSFFDTCYDFSKYDKIRIPQVSVSFKGGVEMEIHVRGILYPVQGLKKVCLAFAGNADDSYTSIYGNVQQKTYQVVYDGAKGRVGFAPAGCSQNDHKKNSRRRTCTGKNYIAKMSVVKPCDGFNNVHR
ncbi:unnamed protein product, partial [Dovyalis caffra]